MQRTRAIAIAIQKREDIRLRLTIASGMFLLSALLLLLISP